MKITYERREDGFSLEVKGNPERIRARREAADAFRNFLEKADEAGMIPGRRLRKALAPKERDASASS